MIPIETIKAAVFGLAVGDALGVPVEFKNREWLKLKPVTDMSGYGTHMQPTGTWSDDSSLTFCTIESLCNGYNPDDIANNFIRWKNEAYWSAGGIVFDIGIATSEAISKLSYVQNPADAGGKESHHNGNGSLMRILPLAFILKNKNASERFAIVQEVSSLTHAHIRSVMACYIYIDFAINLLNGLSKFDAFKQTQNTVSVFFKQNGIDYYELDIFKNILDADVSQFTESSIKSDGYVVHSLEASVWCILTSDSYKDAVLKAVNLGYDTDTTACITGGLAGIIWGYKQIPPMWINQLALQTDINYLCVRFGNALNKYYS